MVCSSDTHDALFKQGMEAFEQMLLALMGLITELDTVEVVAACARDVAAEGHDLYSLLYNFLTECLFQFNADMFVARRVRILDLNRSSHSIRARLEGETFNLAKHPPGIEVKAITYSSMRITEESDRTDLLVIVDI